MLKKNQITLVLLTLILMLSIYYIKDPFKKTEKDPENGSGEVQTSGRLEQLSELRLALTDERNLRIVELDSVIASENATVNEKNLALEEKKYLNALSEKEIMFETELLNAGYQDAFVHASSYGVEITVVSEQNSASLAAQIIKDARVKFHDIESVNLIFKTVQQVVGTATNS